MDTQLPQRMDITNDSIKVLVDQIRDHLVTRIKRVSIKIKDLSFKVGRKKSNWERVKFNIDKTSTKMLNNVTIISYFIFFQFRKLNFRYR